MHDDDSAGTALGALADEPVPVATTRLDDVIRKGKRRLRVQRVAAVGGAVAVVAVIAAGTLLFRPGSPDGSVPVASRPTTPTTSQLVGYTPVSGPRSVAVTTPDAPSSEGAAPTLTTTKALPPPSGVIGVGECPTMLFTPVNEANRLAPEMVAGVFVNGFVAATNRKPVAFTPGLKDEQPPTPDGPGTARFVASDGGGEIILDVTEHAGSPTNAADSAIDGGGECASARRKTLADGTVLQIYPRGQKGQSLVIFGQSGRAYVLTVVPDTRWPVDEAQLATIADVVAKLG